MPFVRSLMMRWELASVPWTLPEWHHLLSLYTYHSHPAPADRQCCPRAVLEPPMQNLLVEASYSILVQVEGQAWFGGGADLTPAYLCEQDAREFHAFWSKLCSQHQVGLALLT